MPFSRILSRSALILALAALPAFSQSGQWKFSVGAAYVSGLQDVTDYYESRYNADVDVTIPVGVMFTPYYELKNGVRICGDLGPVVMVSGDFSFLDVPVGAAVGYAFTPSSDISPYVRGGIRHHIVSGDDVEGSDPGVLPAAGVDFSMNRRVRWGFEAAIDTSTVKFERRYSAGYFDLVDTYEAKPHKFMLGVHVTF